MGSKFMAGERGGCRRHLEAPDHARYGRSTREKIAAHTAVAWAGALAPATGIEQIRVASAGTTSDVGGSAGVARSLKSSVGSHEDLSVANGHLWVSLSDRLTAFRCICAP
jgi:hypothetical protein